MGKKRKSDQAFEVVVEDSREPAAYTIGSQAEQQQAQDQWDEQQEQPQQQHKGGGGYDQAEGDNESRPGYHHVYPGGSRIDPDTLGYLTEVCEMLSGMSDPEEAQLLRSNVLEEISDKLMPLATDAASSTLLEQLLSGAPVSQLMQFLEAFTDGDQLWRLAGAAFGSHVAEKVLAWIHAAGSTAGAADGSDPAAAADGTEGVETLLEALVSAVESHIVDYATDKHATHVARALLVVVAGRDVLTPPGKKQRQRQRQQQGGGEEEEGQAGGFIQQQPKGVFGRQRSSLAEKLEGSSVAGVTTAARFPALLRRLVKCLPLFDPQQMSQLGKNTYGGPLLQAMLRAAALDESLLMLLLPPILGLDPSKAAAAAPGQRLATLTDSHVGRLLRDDCYSHLLEVAVAVMPQAAATQGSAEPAGQGLAAGDAEQDQETEGGEKKKKKREQEDGDAVQSAANGAAAVAAKGVSLEDEFYERFLKGRLLPLCCHHCANFVIQAVLSATHNKTRVAAYVTELSPHLGDLLRRRRSGVVAALAAAAARAGPGPHQAALVAALSTALGQLSQWQGRTGTAHLAPALMTLDTQAVLGAAAGSSGSTTKLSTPGCAMLALLLGQFPAAAVAPFWESVGALQQGDVLRVAKDPSGSRMLEAALAVASAEGALSKRALRKLKKKQKAGEADDAAAAAGSEGAHDPAAAARAALLQKLQGNWASIMQVPSGSFLMEAVYNSMASDQAEALVAELAVMHDQIISRCSWGSKVSKKLGLEAYLRSPEEWRKRAAAAANTRKEFQQLLETSGKQKATAGPAPAAAAAAVVPPPAAATAAVADAEGHDRQQQQQQQEQQQMQQQKQQAPAEKLGKNARKKLRRKAEAAAAAAAAAVAKGTAADAAEPSKKQARVPAAKAAAGDAGAEAGEHAAAGEGSSKEGKKQKKRKQQSGAEAAAEAGTGTDATVNGTGHSVKKKRTKEQKEVEQQGVPDGVDLVALLGYGGLSAGKQHSSAKKK